MRKVIFLAITCFLLVPALAVAQVPQTMSYQGMLRDDATQGPISDGNYTITFRLYNAPSGGALLWGEAQLVPVEGGLFSVTLGNINPLTLPFNATYWITIQLAGNPETSPRAALTSVPYALRALTADMGDTDWIINGDNIYRLTGRVGIGTTVAGPRQEEPKGDDVPRTFSDAKLVIEHDLNPVYARLWEADAAADGRAALYGYRTRTVRNDGTDYTPGGTNNAITGYNWWGDSFTFGVAGFSYNDYTETGGVLGSNVSGSYWGALGYKDASSNGWGIYTPNYAYIGGWVTVGGFSLPPGAVDGYVLTCNASGHGTWQPASGGGFTLPYYGSGDSTGPLFGITNNGTGDVAYFHSSDVNAGLAAIYTTHDGPGRVIEATQSGSGQAAILWNTASDNTSAVVDAHNSGTGPAILGETNGMVAASFEADASSDDTHALQGIFTGTGAYNACGVYGESTPTDYYGVGGEFRGGYLGIRAIVNPTGSLYYYGVVGGVHAGSGTNRAIYGSASGGSSNYAGYFYGNAHVTGTLSKGGGSFKIDHPLDPENKYLYHSFVESPDMMNVYNGNVELDATGAAWVEMPDWFEAHNQDFRYQLTPIGAPGPNLYVAEEVQGNRFKIAGGAAGMTVSWQLTGVRHDRWAEANRIPVEEWKQDRERGLYLHAAAFGQPENRDIEYEELQRLNHRSQPVQTPKLDRNEVRQQRAANER
jgi:hypothetical protein